MLPRPLPSKQGRTGSSSRGNTLRCASTTSLPPDARCASKRRKRPANEFASVRANRSTSIAAQRKLKRSKFAGANEAVKKLLALHLHFFRKRPEINGAGEGNRTLVTAIVVRHVEEWSISLGNSIESQAVSCTT